MINSRPQGLKDNRQRFHLSKRYKNFYVQMRQKQSPRVACTKRCLYYCLMTATIVYRDFGNYHR